MGSDRAPDPIAYTCPVPVQADFTVTGLVQNGEWQDPSDLEAARSLLQASDDLKIGIWDLVGNATLRRTLLEAVPSAPPPPIAVAFTCCVPTLPNPESLRRRPGSAPGVSLPSISSL